ncbi:MAG: SWIM zinc finger domain-containing protein [Tannerella sp.]|jgi:hypothetical protein|nr:SWIM zinc finger domain-containing protein [Tannerella sp.]
MKPNNMMTDNFTELQQTSENRWQAHYHGNYGTYTVKLELDENGRRKHFSCTCPSDGYPCKHIGFLQTAIKDRVKKFEDKQKKNELTVEDILQNVSLDELRAFVIKKAKYNNELTKTITLEFAEKLKQSTKPSTENIENIYKPLVAADLNGVFFDEEDYDYDDEGAKTDLSILEGWFDKANDLVNQQKYEDALLLSQAVIEEYADWYKDANDETRDNIFTDYQTDFFELLHEMAKNEQIDKCLLYDYCKRELSNKKYFSDICNMFGDLMASLANSVNPDEFIAMQKELLKKIPDQSSSEAAKIVKRLYDFYLSNNQNENASELVEENLQIESFCKIAIEKRISEKRYDEAKQLLLKYEGVHNKYHKNDWNEYKLDIAQKEKDIPVIRKIAFEFIENSFDKKHFGIYKTAFSEDEWKEEFERLYQHYDKKGKAWFYESYNSNIPDLLVVENLTERLINYMETHLSVQIMEKYHTHFAGKYPEKTLKMFRKSLDSYADANVGEKHYDYVSKILKLMRKLPNGFNVVSEMIDNYRMVYKRRSKMMEILKKT